MGWDGSAALQSAPSTDGFGGAVAASHKEKKLLLI